MFSMAHFSLISCQLFLSIKSEKLQVCTQILSTFCSQTLCRFWKCSVSKKSYRKFANCRSRSKTRPSCRLCTTPSSSLSTLISSDASCGSASKPTRAGSLQLISAQLISKCTRISGSMQTAWKNGKLITIYCSTSGSLPGTTLLYPLPWWRSMLEAPIS